MELIDCNVFLGPNIAALRPCARAVLGDAAAFAVTDVVCERAGDLLREVLDAGIRLPDFTAGTGAQLFLNAALAIQRALAGPTWWGSIAELDNGLVEVAFEVMRPVAAREIAECALALVTAACDGAFATSFETAYRRMRDAMALRLRHYFAFERRQIAAQLGIECRQGFGMHRSWIRLGQGRHTRFLAPGYFGSTSHLGKSLAGDKAETYAVLAAQGLPVARQQVAYSAAQAVQAAAAIGYPVVLKPVRSSRGRGVATNLRCEADVVNAYADCGGDYPDVVVEASLRGDDYRLLVIDGACVAAVRRPLPSVVGDGVHTVAELIEAANRNEGRDDLFLFAIVIDAEVERALADQGCALASVVAAGRRIVVRRFASPASMASDVSDDVHPDNRAAAVAAAQACGLDFAGIDFVSPDIAVSWQANGGGIVEVNAGPAVDLHMFPQGGAPRDPSRRLIRRCVPACTAGRMPTVMVTGYRKKRAAVDRVAGLLALLGFRPGVLKTHTDPVRSYRHEGDTALRVAALLADENVGTAVFGVPLRTLALEGAPTACTTVSVLTDDYFPEPDVAAELRDANALARIHALACNIATAAVVIDGSRPALRAAVAQRPRAQVGFVWNAEADTDRTALTDHLGAGGWAVIEELRDGAPWLVVKRGVLDQPVAALADLPGAGAGLTERMAAMFSLAVAVALGVPPAALATALCATAPAAGAMTTLQLNPFEQPAAASCDPRDVPAVAQLATYAGANAGRLWLAASNDRWTAACIDVLVRRFDALAPYWYCVGEPAGELPQALRALGVPATRIRTGADLDHVREIMADLAWNEDLLVLLDPDATTRQQWCAPEPSLPVPPPSNVLWDAAELPDLVDGAWVCGPASGWGAQGVAWDCEQVAAGDLAIVPYPADRALQADDLERRVLEAYRRGAAGVIAPAMPLDLPRWRPLLVCDDPQRGLEWMARAKRAEFARPVLAVSGNQAAALAADLSSNLGGAAASSRPFLDRRSGPADVWLATLLALARTPADAAAAIYPVAWDGPALGMLRPTHWVVDLTDPGAEDAARVVFDLLPSACRIVALVASAPSDVAKALSARGNDVHVLEVAMSRGDRTTGPLVDLLRSLLEI